MFQQIACDRRLKTHNQQNIFFVLFLQENKILNYKPQQVEATQVIKTRQSKFNFSIDKINMRMGKGFQGFLLHDKFVKANSKKKNQIRFILLLW